MIILILELFIFGGARYFIMTIINFKINHGNIHINNYLDTLFKIINLQIEFMFKKKELAELFPCKFFLISGRVLEKDYKTKGD